MGRYEVQRLPLRGDDGSAAVGNHRRRRHRLDRYNTRRPVSAKATEEPIEFISHTGSTSGRSAAAAGVSERNLLRTRLRDAHLANLRAGASLPFETSSGTRAVSAERPAGRALPLRAEGSASPNRGRAAARPIRTRSSVCEVRRINLAVSTALGDGPPLLRFATELELRMSGRQCWKLVQLRTGVPQ
jgi:hypothetical protein